MKQVDEQVRVHAQRVVRRLAQAHVLFPPIALLVANHRHVLVCKYKRRAFAFDSKLRLIVAQKVAKINLLLMRVIVSANYKDTTGNSVGVCSDHTQLT